MCFAERLSELRRDKRIQQSELAEILGINTQNLSNYERGLYEPDFELLVAFAKYYNISLDYLFGLIDEETSYDRSNAIILPKGFPKELIPDVQKYIEFLLFKIEKKK